MPKRKFNVLSTITSPMNSLESKEYCIRRKNSVETSEGPSRFDLPEIEELTLGVFSSFDDITYNTQPIMQAPEKNSIGQRTTEEIYNEDISNVFLSHTDEINFTKILNKKEDASDDDWIGTDESLKYENIRTPSTKKFRFDFDEENRVKHFLNNQSDSTSNASTMSFDNHAKIIREVLKKYPHLVQHNKNIRLKIMQREARNTDSSSGKTKISYVELKSDFLMLDNSEELHSKHTTDSHTENNDTGPWKCLKCSLNEEYRDYYMYRRHMQDVHGERFDPRICEHCGYKATKRNILMYHMYTKHNVSPPKNMSFPKCHICPYIALSESLLIRHQVNHKHLSKQNLNTFDTNAPQVTDCEESISNYNHIVYKKANDSQDLCSKMEQQFFHCFNCDQHFSKIDNFKVHLTSHHKNSKDTVRSSNTSNQISSSENVNNMCSITELFDKNEFQVSCKKGLLDLQQRDITNYVDSERENEVVMLIENDEDNHQSYHHDFAENNKIFVENNSGNTIIYIRKLQNDNSEGKSSLNTSDNKKCTYNLGSDEVVEEVVEELETLEDGHHFEQINKNFNIEKAEYNIQQCINASNKKIVLSEVDNLIQYVEEETEILEYETNTDI